MISAETREARLAGADHAVSPCVRRPYLGHQENAVALTGDHTADKFLGATVAIDFCRVDQRHPERKTSAQSVFLDRLRMFVLSKVPGSLAERRYDGAIAELHCSPRPRGGAARRGFQRRCA